jgi:hypothetical protein
MKQLDARLPGLRPASDEKDFEPVCRSAKYIGLEHGYRNGNEEKWRE